MQTARRARPLLLGAALYLCAAAVLVAVAGLVLHRSFLDLLGALWIPLAIFFAVTLWRIARSQRTQV